MTTLKLPPRPRILIVRRDNIGDLVCTTPAFAALRRHYPDAEIAALVNSYNAEVLKGNPHIDRVFVYRKLKHAGSMVGRLKAIAQRFMLIAKLRRWKPDVTILAKASYERHGLNFARRIGAQNVIGYMPDDLSQTKNLPDIQVVSPEFASCHEVEAVNQLLNPLGINDALEPLQVFPNKQVVAELNVRIPYATNRIALHISAREPGRRWGEDNFIELIQYILETRPQSQIMLFWSPGSEDDIHHPGDDATAARLIKIFQSDRLIPMPTKNLSELIAALSLCELFIGADGGAMHLSAALNKKTLGLFENLPEKLNHWYPWRVSNQILHSGSEIETDIAQISQTQVRDALRRLS